MRNEIWPADSFILPIVFLQGQEDAAETNHPAALFT
jgi:hypothetical protein